MGKKVNRYSDIIDLPHHQSARRPHMPVYNRAAQFAPFAALSGYDTMVRNTAASLLLDKRVVLDEDWKVVLEHKFQTILKNPTLPLKIEVVYFGKETSELNGHYIRHIGCLQKIKEHPARICFEDGQEIFVEDIINISEFNN